MGDSAGIAVTVAPSQAAYFAGETFDVTITFTNLNEPSTSYAHHFHRPQSATPVSAFTPSHRRGAQSVVAFPASIPHTPRTAASYISTAALPEDCGLASREQSEAPIPKQRGFIGKGKQKEEAEPYDPPSAPPSAPPNGISQFKRKHAPKSLSVSGVAGDIIGAPRTPLSKLDTGPLDSLIDCKTLLSSAT